MNIKQFLDLLDPRDGWILDEDGTLADKNCDCPLWHVYRTHYEDLEDDDAEDYIEAVDYLDAGRRCGLRQKDAIAIAQAADDRGNPRLRKRLLAAVGIEQETPQ